jgi:hypothetical protein
MSAVKKDESFARLNLALCGAVLLCALVGFFAGCAAASRLGVSAPAPEWVFSPSATYADERYLSAVGWDKDRSVSESKAKAELAKTIRQTVESQSFATVSYAETQGVFSEGRSIETSVNTSTELQIAGVSIREVWQDKTGVYYALALLDRDEAGRYYRTHIQNNTETIGSQNLFAQKNQQSFDSYATAKRALTLAKENDEHLALLSAINPAMFQLTRLDYGSSSAVAEFTRNILSGISIALSITGDEDGSILASFAKVLTNAGFSPVFASTGNYPYTLKITVAIEDVGIVGRYQTVRYTMDAVLFDVLNGKVLLPFAANGRESHTTQAEARRRAIRLINDDVEKKFAVQFAAFLE